MTITFFENILKDKRVQIVDSGTLIRYPDCDIEALDIPMADIVQAWHYLRDIAPASGFWPVIIELPSGPNGGQGEDWLHNPSVFGAEVEPATQVIEQALQINLGEWIAQQGFARTHQLRHSHKTHEELRQEILADPYISPEIEGFWLEAQGPAAKTHSRFYLSVVPTAQSWLVPAYLRFPAGNPRDNAVLYTLIAFSRKWASTFGAQIATASDLEVEFFVTDPPANWPDALQLAYEHFLFCHDSFQTVTTLEKKAAMLLQCPYWHFGWD